MRAINSTINRISQLYEEREISGSKHFFGSDKYQYFNRKGEAVGPVFEDSVIIGNLVCFCQRYRDHGPAYPIEYGDCGVFDLENNDYIFKPEYDEIGYDENTKLILRCREEDLYDYEDEVDKGIEKGLGFPSAVRISDKYGVDLIDRPFAEIEILNKSPFIIEVFGISKSSGIASIKMCSGSGFKPLIASYIASLVAS